MTTKQIENVTKTYTTVYVAADGTEFDDKDACKMYDKSFACVMKSMLNKIAINSSTEEDLFYTGSCETDVLVVIPKTEEDILHIKQLAIGLGMSEDNVNRRISESDINKIILIDIGYGNEWAFVSRFDDMVDKITAGKYKLVPSE